MALSAHTCIEHAKYTTGGEMPAHISGLSVVNEAGEFLVNAHPWRFLETLGTLDLVAGQNYAVLPANFRGIYAINPTAGRTSGFEWVGAKGIIDLRTEEFVNGAFYYWGYIEHADPSTATVPAQREPRLALYTTPQTSDAGALTIAYTAGWKRLTSDNELLNTPDWLDGLLVELIIAVARGYVEEDEMSKSKRLEEVMNGVLWRTAVKRDAEEQGDYGIMTGGAAQRTWGLNYFRNETSVNAPS